MAVINAIGTGNWSDPSVWPGGVLPGPSDQVHAAGYTITIDQDITVLSIRTDDNSGGTPGGGFVAVGTRVLNCEAIAGTSICLTYAGTGTITINKAVGGSVNNAHGITNNSTGIINVNNVVGGSASNAHGVYNNNGTVNADSVIGGTASNAYGITNNSNTAIVNVNNVAGGSANYSYGIYNTNAGTVNAVSVVGGSIEYAYGIYNHSTGIVNAITIIGGQRNLAYGVVNNAGGTINADVVVGTNTINCLAFGVYNSLPSGIVRVKKLQFGQYGASPTYGIVYIVPDPINLCVMVTQTLANVNVAVANLVAVASPELTSVIRSTISAELARIDVPISTVAPTTLAGTALQLSS